MIVTGGDRIYPCVKLDDYVFGNGKKGQVCQKI